MNTSLSETSSSRLLSAKERDRAAAYLAATRDETLQAVEGLSVAQWNFNATPERWSVLEILEHLTIIESRVGARVAEMGDAPEADAGRNDAEVDDLICTMVPQRSMKVEAPPPICPTRQWSPAETVERFCSGREETIQLLDTAPCLRGRVRMHPVAGAWDGYQWLLATAAHNARHLDQIREVQGDPGFPRE